MNRTRLSVVNIIIEKRSKLFDNGIVFKKLGLYCICATIFKGYTQFFYTFANSEITYLSVYQNLTEGKFTFFDKTLWKSSELYFLEPGLLSSITNIVEAMNTFIQGRHNRSCITVEECRRKQTVELHLAIKRSGLAFFSKDLGHIFGCNVGNEFRAILRRKGPHKPKFVRMHSLRIYTDLIEWKIGAKTEAPLLRYFPCISTLKAGDIITTGQYMNYQTFSNLQFRRLLKIDFHSNHIDLRDTSGEKIPFLPAGITGLVLVFRKASNTNF